MKLVKIEAYENTNSRNYDYTTWINPKHVVQITESGRLTTIELMNGGFVRVKGSAKKVIKNLKG